MWRLFLYLAMAACAQPQVIANTTQQLSNLPGATLHIYGGTGSAGTMPTPDAARLSPNPANATVCVFECDKPGDYEVPSNSTSDTIKWRIHAIAADLQISNRFEDSFQRDQDLLSDSDSSPAAWSTNGSSKCATTVSGALKLSGPCRVATTTTATAFEPVNFFGEPIVIKTMLQDLSQSVNLSFGFIIGGIHPFDSLPGIPHLRVELSASSAVLIVSNGTSEHQPCRATVKPSVCGTGTPLKLILAANVSLARIDLTCQGKSVLATVCHQPHRLQASMLGNALGESAIFVDVASQGVVTSKPVTINQIQVLGVGEPAGVVAATVNPARGFARIRSPQLGIAHQANLEIGILDATLPPFLADPTGKKDSSAALSRAIEYARRNSLVTFLPSGNYTVTDTITCVQKNTLGNGRFFPCSLRGTAGTVRARIMLPPNTPTFTNAHAPKPVLYFWRMNTDGYSQPNIHMNQVIENIDIVIGEGNFGAVGINNRGAQGSGVEDVNVYAGDGFAGLWGASGSGGSQHSISVYGGAYGLQFNGSQPAGTASGIKLVDQVCAAVVYTGTNSISLVGVNITASANADVSYNAIVAGGFQKMSPASFRCTLQEGWTDLAIDGHISITDTSIQYQEASPTANKRIAISATTSLWLSNVYVTGWDHVAHFPRTGSSWDLPSGSSAPEWSLLVESAHNDPPPPHRQKNSSYNLTNTIWVDGVQQQTDLMTWATGVHEPPSDLVSQHQWPQDGAFPSFETPGAQSAKNCGATGDGVTDDTMAIQTCLDNHDVVLLPRGFYRLSSTLRVHPGKALIGIAHFLVNLAPVTPLPARLKNFSWPMVRVLGGSGAGPSYLFGTTCLVWWSVPNVTCLLWEAEHPRSVFRRNAAWLKEELGTTALRGQSPLPAQPHGGAINLVTGAGLFYTTHAEDSYPMLPSYRSWMIENNTGPVRIYHLNMEHAESDANAEFSNASDVSVFGLKSEGQYCVLWIRGSTNISLSGYGGNACPFGTGSYPAGFAQYPPTIFRIEDSEVILGNLVAYDMASTLPMEATSTFKPPIPCPRLDSWSQIFFSDRKDKLLTPPLNRPILFKHSSSTRLEPDPSDIQDSSNSIIDMH